MISTRLIRRYAPAVLWAAMILVLCLIPGKDLPEWGWIDLFSLDKPVHALLFGVLTVLIARPWISGSPAWKVPLVGAFLLAVAYGVLTEYLQQILAVGRTADVFDMLANGVGALLGSVYLRYRMAKVAEAKTGLDP